jgi:hypothetical protein
MSKPKFDRSAVVNDDNEALADLERLDFLRPLDKPAPAPQPPAAPPSSPKAAAPVTPGPLVVGDPRLQDANPADGKVFRGWRIAAIRPRQIAYEAADLGVNEGVVVDRALDMYFKAKRTKDQGKEGGKHGNNETPA